MEPTIDELLAQSRQSFDMGYPDDAAALLRLAIDRFPDAAEPRIRRA